MDNTKRMEIIKEKAMEILRKNKLNDDIREIPDIFGIDEEGEYFHMVWDYPGTRYKQHLNLEDDNAFIRYIVKATIEERDYGRIDK